MKNGIDSIGAILLLIPIMLSQLPQVALLEIVSTLFYSQAQVELAATSSSPLKPNCDLEMGNGMVCYSNGQDISSRSKASGLVGSWGFDTVGCLDNSGNQNHAWASCSFGQSAPGRGGVGNSIYLTNSNYITIPNSPLYSTSSFSLQVWLFWISNNGQSTECPLLQKGKDVGTSATPSTYERAPAIMLNPQTSQVSVLLSTSSSLQGETLRANGRLIHHRWTLLTVTREASTLSLYWNGIMDSIITIKGTDQTNTSPLYVGNSPFYASKCATSLYFDQIQWYSRPLQMQELQAEATSSLGGLDTSTLMFGCTNCLVNQALTSCAQGFNLCSKFQLMLSGQMVAMANGWIYRQDQQIWSQGVEYGSGGIAPNADGTPRRGLALCCKQ